MKYVNVTVRVKKISAEKLEKGINNGDFQYLTICETGRRYGSSIFRYVGDDKEEEGLYFDDLVTQE